MISDQTHSSIYYLMKKMNKTEDRRELVILSNAQSIDIGLATVAIRCKIYFNYFVRT